MKMGISSGITRSPSRPKGGEPTCRDPPNGLPHITYIGFQTGQFLEGPGILILFYFFFVCVCVVLRSSAEANRSTATHVTLVVIVSKLRPLYTSNASKNGSQNRGRSWEDTPPYRLEEPDGTSKTADPALVNDSPSA